jgi:hypothetical protein
MSAPAPVLMMADIATGARYVVAVDIAGLHRRSQRYPALGGDVLQVGHLTTTIPNCPLCVHRARGQPERSSWDGVRVHVTVLTKAA